jgi:clan AA aspartic protease
MPQESGRVNALREAVVRIRLARGKTINCVIDTGFDGALILPTSVVEQLELPVVARLVFELVGGTQMAADVALAEVEWLGARCVVEVIMSEGDDALVGTEMLENTRLVVDYRERSVAIERDA